MCVGETQGIDSSTQLSASTLLPLPSFALHASQFLILPPASPFPILVPYAHLVQELLTQLAHKDDFVTEIPVLSKTSRLDMGTIYTYTETKPVPFVRALCS